MSDSDGDFSDELLALAGAGGEKRKKKQHKSTGKRKLGSHSPSSGNGYESEDDFVNPYPLEGKYKDEADRLRLQQLSEIERENILAQRMEEVQRLEDKRNLDQMLRAQRTGDDAVSRAAKRQHVQRGATKEKSRKLDELKARRKEKSEKKRNGPGSPKRDRSSSPMEMSDEEDEDGQISKLEQEEEREQRLVGKMKANEDQPITAEDLGTCQLTRDQISKYALHPWFEDYARGAWVRYLIGVDKGDPVYRVCEVVNIAPNLTKPYKLDRTFCNQLVELKVGKSIKTFMFDKVSNSSFELNEFEWLFKTCQHEQVKLPTKRALEKKREQMERLSKQTLTSKDIDSILAKKQALMGPSSSNLNTALQKQRLTKERDLAIQRRDFEEASQLEKQLEELQDSTHNKPEQKDLLTMVNERNRKANLEAVRKAEAEAAERRKKERRAIFVAAQKKRAQQSKPGSEGGLESNAKLSLPGTPTLGTPSFGASDGTRSVSPMPLGPVSKKARLETRMVAEVEVDLGDF